MKMLSCIICNEKIQHKVFPLCFTCFQQYNELAGFSSSRFDITPIFLDSQLIYKVAMGYYVCLNNC